MITDLILKCYSFLPSGIISFCSQFKARHRLSTEIKGNLKKSFKNYAATGQALYERTHTQYRELKQQKITSEQQLLALISSSVHHAESQQQLLALISSTTQCTKLQQQHQLNQQQYEAEHLESKLLSFCVKIAKLQRQELELLSSSIHHHEELECQLESQQRQLELLSSSIQCTKLQQQHEVQRLKSKLLSFCVKIAKLQRQQLELLSSSIQCTKLQQQHEVQRLKSKLLSSSVHHAESQQQQLELLSSAIHHAESQQQQLELLSSSIQCTKLQQQHEVQRLKSKLLSSSIHHHEELECQIELERRQLALFSSSIQCTKLQQQHQLNQQQYEAERLESKLLSFYVQITELQRQQQGLSLEMDKLLDISTHKESQLNKNYLAENNQLAKLIGKITNNSRSKSTGHYSQHVFDKIQALGCKNKVLIKIADPSKENDSKKHTQHTQSINVNCFLVPKPYDNTQGGTEYKARVIAGLTDGEPSKYSSFGHKHQSIQPGTKYDLGRSNINAEPSNASTNSWTSKSNSGACRNKGTSQGVAGDEFTPLHFAMGTPPLYTQQHGSSRDFFV